MPPEGCHPVLDDLADASRRAILESLLSGTKTVKRLVALTGLKQPNVSNHLARMRERGIVIAQRSGRYVLYTLSDPIVASLLRTALSGSRPRPERPAGRAELRRWSDRLRRALVEGDDEEADAIVGECLTRRVCLEDLYVGVFQRCLEAVGELEVEGRISVAEEHLATGMVERLVARVSHFHQPGVRHGRRALLGCVAGNRHVVGIRMIAESLRARGWCPLCLGADVPEADFADMVEQVRPEVVLISCALAEHATQTRRLLAVLSSRRERPGAPRFRIGLGGRHVNESADLVATGGADFTAADARGAVAEIEARAQEGHECGPPHTRERARVRSPGPAASREGGGEPRQE
ncbi:MAG: metalloregulator ArsR/SmtB family transcription factor [Chthonomonadales bacterium]|nr:metalloregulator ArsR/SmtB family transcription factor [Chthonomonadales bacterium]